MHMLQNPYIFESEIHMSCKYIEGFKYLINHTLSTTYVHTLFSLILSQNKK